MVSFWPWKGDVNSAASFEKALVTISDKIAHTTTRLDTQRQRSRRFRVIWTLYTTFAYMLYSIILALVLGWKNWGVLEYSGVIGGPLLIYLVRFALISYFDYRISATESQLEALQKQREQTIEKLKAATKYNSTQQLLEKYGGSSAKSTPSKSTPKGGKSSASPASGKKSPQTQPVQQQGGRTGLPPPPTANIRRPGQIPNASPSTPLRQQLLPPSPNPAFGSPPYASDPNTSASFAPNAFSGPPQYAADVADQGPRWYDRLMDVLLGEDETNPRNRIALICSSCRLVNGQAPPGAKTAQDIGKWKCSSCGAWNGEDSVEKQVLKEIQRERGISNTIEAKPSMSHLKTEAAAEHNDDGWKPVSRGDEANVSSEHEADDVETDGEDARPVARRTRRSRPNQRVSAPKVEASDDDDDDDNEEEEELVKPEPEDEDAVEEEEEDTKPVTRSKKGGAKKKGKN